MKAGLVLLHFDHVHQRVGPFAGRLPARHQLVFRLAVQPLGGGLVGGVPEQATILTTTDPPDPMESLTFSGGAEKLFSCSGSIPSSVPTYRTVREMDKYLNFECFKLFLWQNRYLGT